ncbi:YdcF family protein [Alphaproteobacteria bacterium]|nr:YdcF family protein [Alphaproteobacteria bacterium]
MLNRIKIAILFCIIITLYFISFIHFIGNIDKEFTIKKNVNNIVVLTGNTGRLVFGLDLMSNNSKSRMLITGVAKGVKYSEIIKNRDVKRDRIDLGYKAQTTLGNAIETFLWIKEYDIRDIILVTDNWHMQRTLLLFNITMPNIEVSPYPIESMNFTMEDFFQFEKKTFFIYKEHLKYIVSHIQVIYLWLIN